MDKIPTSQLSGTKREKVRTIEEEAMKESLTEGKEAQTTIETKERTKPQSCLNYLGYLFMKKAPNETHIPTECYNCPDLLKCLYSPVLVEKVYGE